MGELCRAEMKIQFGLNYSFKQIQAVDSSTSCLKAVSEREVGRVYTVLKLRDVSHCSEGRPD